VRYAAGLTAVLVSLAVVAACTFEDAKERPTSSDGGTGAGRETPDASSEDATAGDGAIAESDAGERDGGDDGSTTVDAGGTTNAASCKPGGPGMTNCGTANESCCTSPLVQGGAFSRVYASNGGIASGLSFSATVRSFRLDKYEVTVGRFRRFVAAWNGNWRPTGGAGKHVHVGPLGLDDVGSAGAHELGWDSPIGDGQVTPTSTNLASDGSNSTWTVTPAGNENKPINTVNWYEAFVFCIFDGGFLPSEAEWEYAAAGGAQQRDYPWGAAAPTTSLANYGCFDRADCDGANSIKSVGMLPGGAGLWGQLDLAGNVWEWTMDWYVGDPTHYQTSSCVDCVSATPPDPNIGRSSRSGDFLNNDTNLPARLRNQYYGSRRSDQRDGLVGFRCARSP